MKKLKIVHHRETTQFILTPDLSFHLAHAEDPKPEKIEFAKTKAGYTVSLPHMDFPIIFKPGDKITITLE